MSKIIRKKDLGEMSPQEIIHQTKNGKSLLLTIGSIGDFIKAKLLGVVVNMLWLFIVEPVPASVDGCRGHIRGKLRDFLKKATPEVASSGWNSVQSSPVVIGFNHSTSGDLFRVLGYILSRNLDRPIVLPVSLVAYEACSNMIIAALEVADIYLCPVISRGYYSKIKTDKNTFLMRQLKVRLETYYQVSINECVKKNGVAIVPLGFDKHPTVFKNVAESKGVNKTTLNLDITKIARFLKKHQRVHYVAMSINPKTNKTGLNLSKVYTLECTFFRPERIKALRLDKDIYELEWRFLNAIALKLPYERWHPKEE